MGANFSSVNFKASDEKTLRESFSLYQRELCNSRGDDSYAGHLGIARGLEIIQKTFKTKNEAYDYVVDTAQKWGAAVAVRVGNFSKVFPVTATEKKEVQKLEELKQKYTNWDKDILLRTKQAKSTQRGCKKCESKIAIKYIVGTNCPVCGNSQFIKTETDEKAFKALVVKMNEQVKKVAALESKYKEINKNNTWFVGAWCAE